MGLNRRPQARPFCTPNSLVLRESEGTLQPYISCTRDVQLGIALSRIRFDRIL